MKLIRLNLAQLILSCPTLCDPMDPIARQAPLSMGFCRQEYWSELLFPSPGDPPDPGIEPTSLALKAVSCIAGKFFTAEPPGKHVLNPAFPHLIQSLTSVT